MKKRYRLLMILDNGVTQDEAIPLTIWSQDIPPSLIGGIADTPISGIKETFAHSLQGYIRISLVLEEVQE